MALCSFRADPHALVWWLATTSIVSNAAVPQKTLVTFLNFAVPRDIEAPASSGCCGRMPRLVAFARESALMEFLTFLHVSDPKIDYASGRSSP
jgi:hypothetical protein